MNDGSVHPSPTLGTLLHDVEVDEVRLHRLSRRLKHPLRTARGVIEERELVLVELRAFVRGVEVRGWGEAAPLPGWGTDTLAEVRYDLGRLRDAVFAGGEQSPTRLLAMLRPPTARFAFSSALLDAVAHGRGRSLRHLIDPDAPHSVPVNAIIGLETPARTAELAEQAVEAGYSTIKLKVGTADDLERVDALRRAAPRVSLRLDANGAWAPAAAIENLRALASFDVEYLEQPLAAEDIDGLQRLSETSPIALAADESCLPIERGQELVERGVVPVLVLKPALLGSWDEVIELFGRARERGIRVVFTSAVDSVVARYATAQMAAALLGGDVACGLGSSWLERDLADREVSVRAGRLNLGSGNGIGFVPQIDENA